MDKKLKQIVLKTKKETLGSSFQTCISYSDWGISITAMGIDGNSISKTYIYNDDSESIYFSSLYVNGNRRKNGIARKMMEFHSNLAIGMNRTSYLTVLEGSWMQKWYQRLEYKKVENPTTEAGNNYIWMSKLCKQKLEEVDYSYRNYHISTLRRIG